MTNDANIYLPHRHQRDAAAPQNLQLCIHIKHNYLDKCNQLSLIDFAVEVEAKSEYQVRRPMVEFNSNFAAIVVPTGARKNNDNAFFGRNALPPRQFNHAIVLRNSQRNDPTPKLGLTPARVTDELAVA